MATGYDVFKFVELDTQLVEIEDGMTENESVTRSVRSAIEAAVYELILQGDEKGFWTIAWPITTKVIKKEITKVFDEKDIVLVEEKITEEKEEKENEDNK